MCTLTTIPRGTGYRLRFNRDELRARALAEGPERRVVAGTTALLPIDPDSGGTWIAATARGIALALLNLNEPGAPSGGGASRGGIVPALLDCADLAEMRRRLERHPVHRHAPFRLVAVAPGPALLEACWDGRALSLQDGPLAAPLLRVSSGLGDARAELVRAALWRGLAPALAGADAPAAQDRFHRARRRRGPVQSCCMSRRDARTVSWSRVEADADRILFEHGDGPPDRPGRRWCDELPLASC